MNVKETLAAIRALGLSATRTDCGEYRIAVKGAAATAYFTEDATDALETAKAMAGLADETTALRDDSPETVAAYFARVLGRPLADPQTPDRGKPPVFSPYHRSFTVDTGCGEACKHAIDACRAFVEPIREAFGKDSDDEFKAIEICASVVLCYVYG